VTEPAAPDPTTPLPSETQAPGEIEIVLYWVVGEELQPEYRRIPSTQAVGTAALELLLAGPQQPGLSTAIPTPEEVQSYPGRQADWGDRVRLLGLTIEDGVATANFSQEMRAYGGGSARVHMIREQITQTLLQFPTVQEVRIAVEGEVETALQP
jgi:spore germination protein GerM